MSIVHGANIYQLSKTLGIEKDSIIDFSSNINPYGVSPKALDSLKNNLDKVSIYPDPSYTDLKKSISLYCHCKIDNIVLGSGATELISSAIKIINPKHTLLLAPFYSEYAKELNSINSKITKFYYEKENNFKFNLKKFINLIKEENFDMIIICNPNNPTGQLISIEEIKEIISNFKKPIMIDETYIEFTDFKDTSAISLIEEGNLIVIRGTSKFFSTPGIRLGYSIISEGALLNSMKQTPNLWNINIFATIMGEAMFQDTDFLNMCYFNFKNNFKLLFNGLKMFSDFKVYDSKSNFILCEILNTSYTAEDLYNYLAKKNIIIRKAKDFDKLNNQFFRVCVLTEENIKTLLKEIDSFIKINK